jgi:UDP-N-acetylmuramate: L-alanyl-gamma-D-glutamyl-meso-diaminopimelate ligase
MPELRHNDNPADFIDGNVVVETATRVGSNSALNKDFYAICVKNGHEAIEKIAAKAVPGDVLVIMSNGSFDGIHEKLIAVLEALARG